MAGDFDRAVRAEVCDHHLVAVAAAGATGSPPWPASGRSAAGDPVRPRVDLGGKGRARRLQLGEAGIDRQQVRKDDQDRDDCVEHRTADRTVRQLRSLGLGVEALDLTDALAASRLWPATRSVGLSLGDRCCLALAARLQGPAVTADTAWTGLDLGVTVIPIR